MDLGLLADPAVLAELILQGLVRGSVYALVGVGLSLTFGILRIVNFAQGEFFMIGSYLMYFALTILGLPFVVGVVAAACLVFVVGVAVETGLIKPLRKRAGRDWVLDSFVLTIGVMIILQNVALIMFGGSRHGVTRIIPGVLSIHEITISYERLAILLTSTAVGIALWAFIKYTSLGKAIRATAQDPEAAQTLGINVDQIYTIAFGIGTGLAGAAGAMLISIFPAYPTVGAEPVLKGFAVVVIGGMGNVSGAIAGGLMLGLLEAFTFFMTSAGWQNVLIVVLILIIMIFKPSGLFTPKGVRT